MTEEKRGLSLSEVLRQLEDTHGHLIAIARRTSEGQFTRDTRLRRRLRLDTYSHYPQHAEAIRKWREQRLCESKGEPGYRPRVSRAPGERALRTKVVSTYPAAGK